MNLGEISMEKKLANRLINFLDESVCCFQAVDNIKKLLLDDDFTELRECDKWNVEPGGKYFVTRNGSSIIAFKVPEKGIEKWHITATHSDSPSFKVKENPENCDGRYVRINVEPYGGGIYSTWMDKPISVAGRVVIKKNGEYVTRLVNVDRDLLMIPNLAIHMDKTANAGHKYDPKKDMLPLYGTDSAKGTFMDEVASYATNMDLSFDSMEEDDKHLEAQGDLFDTEILKGEDILAYDLYLYNRMKGKIWGGKDEFICAPRIDNLQCTFGTLMGFLEGQGKEQGSVYCVFDNEEVGSGTKQGAESTFLRDVIERIGLCLGMDREDVYVTLAKSFMISADNAHGYHPNHPEVADKDNSPILNGGIVIKYNANQKYCTDGLSAAVFKDLCKSVNVPYQIYTNRADMPGGSTLGNISSTKVSINSVDIGLAQLAMHSAYETAGAKDVEYLAKVCAKFFE